MDYVIETYDFLDKPIFRWTRDLTLNEKLDVISKLENGWDNNDAKAFTSDTVSTTKDYLEATKADDIVSLFPTCDSSIILTYDIGDVYIRTTIYNRNKVKVFIDVDTSNGADEKYYLSTKTFTDVDFGVIKWFIRSSRSGDINNLLALWRTYPDE